MSKQSTIGAMAGLALCALASLAPCPAAAQGTDAPVSRLGEGDATALPAVHEILTPRVLSDLQYLLEEYQEHNQVPALSAALNLNGQTLWAQGAGVLDEQGRPAQADSVYALASVSKAITATLVGRLEERGYLSDGTPLELSGEERSSRWLHRTTPDRGPTLRQLMSHTGCVPHYSSTPSVPNTTRHYAHQIHSARRIARLGPIYGCSVGRTRIYSTAGFTIVGAVLESATWTQFSTLVQQEVAEAFGLRSIRVMYDAPTLAPNPKRATWFHRGHRIPFHNTSWKAPGGGLEGNAIDLARFGGLLANGELVSKPFRDRTMLVRQPGSSYGYGWKIERALDRRRVRHGGASAGSRSELSVWPDQGLSIALLSNSRHHVGLRELSQQMAKRWFDAVEESRRASESKPRSEHGAPWEVPSAGRGQNAQGPCVPSDASAPPPEPSVDRSHERGCSVQSPRSARWLAVVLLGLLRPRRSKS